MCILALFALSETREIRKADVNAEPHMPAPGGVLALVDEEGTYDHVLKVGRTLAGETGSALILYESKPTGGPGPGGGPLEPEDLLRRDRTALAEAVVRARGDGIDAWGWIAGARDPDGLVTCARDLDASVIVLPAELEDGSLPDGWRDDRLEVANDGSVNLVVVDRAGHLVGPA
jgi:hypothetical protein